MSIGGVEIGIYYMRDCLLACCCVGKLYVAGRTCDAESDVETQKP